MYDELDTEFKFDLDPCATDENHKCRNWFTKADNGLLQDWKGKVFMNPPYGREIGQWMKKAFEEVANGNAEVVVSLVPARTDTAWWHNFSMKGDIRFLRGRLKFGDAKSSAPFPSAIIIFKGATSGMR
jgi:site-specific DNA-methyltransferase (adenine-specific)